MTWNAKNRLVTKRAIAKPASKPPEGRNTSNTATTNAKPRKRNVQRIGYISTNQDFTAQFYTYLGENTIVYGILPTTRFIGAVAGAVVTDEAKDFAHENGMYVIVQSGKAVEIVPTPEGFKAKEW